MRDIEFRAFRPKFGDDKQDVMTEPFTLGSLQDCEDFNFTDGGYVGYNEFGLEHPDTIVMQYTGLKDKNGIKIFEGDIVTNENSFGCISGWGDKQDEFPNIRIVTYVEKDAKFGFRFVQDEFKDKAVSGYCLCKSNENIFEVIGNIYENSNLLSE